MVNTTGLLTLVNLDDDICALEVFIYSVIINLDMLTFISALLLDNLYKFFCDAISGATALVSGYMQLQFQEPLFATLVTC